MNQGNHRVSPTVAWMTSCSFLPDRPIVLSHDTDTDDEIEDETPVNPQRVAMLERYCKWIKDEAAREPERPSILSDSFIDFVRLL